jgi:formate/nitrite transporter FocA (FNT family)
MVVMQGRALGWLAFSWLTNFVGAGFVAYFMAYQGGWTSKDPVKEFVMANAVKKIDLKFGVAFLRGIGANWLVCLAWWQAISSKVRPLQK